MRSSAALVVVAALAVPAAASAQTWVTLDVNVIVPAARELAAVRAEYAAALNSGDAGRSSALYAPDAIAVLDDGPALRGRAEISRYFQQAFEARAAGVAVLLSPQRFRVDDDVASETGSFLESRQGEPPEAATGVYVTIYRRDAGGEWRIAMELRTRGRDKQIVRW